MMDEFQGAALCGGYGHRVTIIIVALPNASRQTALFKIVNALDAQRTSFGFGQRGQQHGRQDRDDRDNYEQFNESERSYFTEFLHMFLLVIYSANSLRTLGNSFSLSTRILKKF